MDFSTGEIKKKTLALLQHAYYNKAGKNLIYKTYYAEKNTEENKWKDGIKSTTI